MRRAVLLICCVLGVDNSAIAQPRIEHPNGPPPRFMTLSQVDVEKSEAIFILKVLGVGLVQSRMFEYPDGTRRHVLASTGSHKPAHVQHYGVAGEAYKVPFKKARWYDLDGNEVPGEGVWKELKPGAQVVMSADGKPVNRAYSQLFAKEIRILVVPEDLPIPYLPISGSALVIEKVPGPGSK